MWRAWSSKGCNIRVCILVMSLAVAWTCACSTALRAGTHDSAKGVLHSEPGTHGVKPPLERTQGAILAFTKDGICIVGPEPTQFRKVSDVKDYSVGAAWDRSGRRIAWIDQAGVWIVDIDTARRLRINLPPTRTEYGPGKLGAWTVPVWDQSGHWLFLGGLITPEVDSDGGLWQVSADNRQSARVIFPPSGASAPLHTDAKLSRNGRYIASGCLTDGLEEMRFYDLHRRREVRPTRVPRHVIGHQTDYAWLSDNRTLIVACDTEKWDWQDRCGPGGIWKLDMKTGRARRWLEAGHAVIRVSLSPDGNRLAYIVPEGAVDSDESKPSVLRVFDMRQHSLRSVWRGFYDIEDNFSWAPDSMHLAISGRGQGDSLSNVWVVNTATGSKQLVARDARRPTWSPRR